VGCDVTLERRPAGGVRKLKQQKLSLQFLSKAGKQDLTSLKEFNGGIRAQTSDLGLANEENRLIEMAVQASIADEERRQKEREELWVPKVFLLNWCRKLKVAVISAKNHKRQSVTAKREKSQTPKVLTAILTLPNLT